MNVPCSAACTGLTSIPVVHNLCSEAGIKCEVPTLQCPLYSMTMTLHSLAISLAAPSSRPLFTSVPGHSHQGKSFFFFFLFFSFLKQVLNVLSHVTQVNKGNFGLPHQIFTVFSMEKSPITPSNGTSRTQAPSEQFLGLHFWR